MPYRPGIDDVFDCTEWKQWWVYCPGNDQPPWMDLSFWVLCNTINCLDDTKHEDFDRVKGDPLTLKSPSCPELCNNPFHPPRPCASGKFYFLNKTPSSLRKSFGYVPLFSDDQICLLKWQNIPSFKTLAPIEHIYSLNFSDLIVVVVGTSKWESV